MDVAGKVAYGSEIHKNWHSQGEQRRRREEQGRRGWVCERGKKDESGKDVGVGSDGGRVLLPPGANKYPLSQRKMMRNRGYRYNAVGTWKWGWWGWVNDGRGHGSGLGWAYFRWVGRSFKGVLWTMGYWQRDNRDTCSILHITAIGKCGMRVYFAFKFDFDPPIRGSATWGSEGRVVNLGVSTTLALPTRARRRGGSRPSTAAGGSNYDGGVLSTVIWGGTRAGVPS
eukprot:754681-Hanusia_phi.AAC.1